MGAQEAQKLGPTNTRRQPKEGKLIAAVLCIVLIWTLIRYRRKGRV